MDGGNRIGKLEIALPWVRTDLMNSREAEQAMPLDEFIAGTMELLGTDADEIVLDGGARAMRANVRPDEHGFVNAFNGQMLALFSE